MRHELVKLVPVNLTSMVHVKLEVHVPPPTPMPAVVQPQLQLPTHAPHVQHSQSPPEPVEPHVQLPMHAPPVQPQVQLSQPEPVEPQVQLSTPAPAVEAQVNSPAPWFRFRPTDEELVLYYLRGKVRGKTFRLKVMAEIDVYKYQPWQLSEFSCLRTRDLEWYFFSPVDKKYGIGCRLNRATGQGYWKATGKDRPVLHQNQVVGMKKSLVFHAGRAPSGTRTDWVMHEYRLADEGSKEVGVSQEKHGFVICRIFEKSGIGSSGTRYAPLVEEEWNDDDDNNATFLVPGAEVVQKIVPEQETNHMTEAPVRPERNMDDQNFPIVCKGKRLKEPEPLSLSQHKKSKPDDPSSSNVNGCDRLSSTNQDFQRTNSSTSELLEFPLAERLEPKPSIFDSSNLEKYVPPAYLNLISDLETGFLNVSKERDTIKLEAMGFLAKIKMLQSRIDFLSEENKDLRNIVQGI